jgi:hypothetical protein
VLSGALISATGYPVSFVVGGAAIGTVGCGLIYTFNIGTSTGKWIGYQIMAGIRNGLGVQVPMIMDQANSDTQDMAAMTAILMCEYRIVLSGLKTMTFTNSYRLPHL